MFTQHTLSNPTISDTMGYWAEYVGLRLQSYALRNSIEVGFEKTKGNWTPGYCGNTGNKIALFIMQYDSGQNKDPVLCTPVNSDNINNPYILQILPQCCLPNGDNYFAVTVSMWDGQQFVENLDCSWTGVCITGMNYIMYIDQFMDHVANGQHWQWGTKWQFNEWCSSNGTCPFQTANTNTNKVDNGPPPAMYWPDPPSNGHSRGTMYTCIYDNTSNGPCTYNG